MKIPFTKAHGARNDFLLTWRADAPEPGIADHAVIARAICGRHTGIGADGWMLVGPRDVTLIDVGNPQCAVPVDDFDFDWRAMGAEIEKHAHFPNRTNVSFVKRVDAHTIDVRFWERGAGETMSSGTGSTGAAATAVERGMAASPVRVMTPAGALELRFEGDVYLRGPAEIIGDGVFFF